MHIKNCVLLLTILLSFSARLLAQLPEIELHPGIVITQSCRVKFGRYSLPVAPGDTSKGQIQVRGNNLVIDFQQAELVSTADPQHPDLFQGIAIDISGAGIELKNARIRGFKIALFAYDAPRLRLENNDFSYNYRPRLLSGREKENEADWLSYHHNERDEWMRYGSGMYLRNCDGSVVRGCRITGCQNALLMTQSDSCLIYNNVFQFNSGLGIGLYRSSHNRLMHNKLDWNVRGYSHGFYARGQDSAGILLYEQSSDNLIAYNSVTHCGDGLFLWAGQSTMDTGLGGCNDNYIFGNDFSHAPTNGIEVTFSRNNIRGNIVRECTYGIWGGYSFGSTIMGNYLAECRYGVAIEHGQDNIIRQNLFQDDTIGIQLWARDKQPEDWAYAQKRDTRSRNCKIDRNVFLNTRKPLKINASSNVAINGENLFFDFERLLETSKPNDSLTFLRNDIYGTTAEIAETWATPALQKNRSLNFSYPDKNPENPFAALDIPLRELNEPDSLADGMLAALPPKFPRGRQFIIMGEWGPFDFRRPEAILDTLAGRQYSLVLLGPSGDWQIKSMKGVKNISVRKGIVPATINFEREPNSPEVRIDFTYSSPQAITTVHGEKIPAGQSYSFHFQHVKKE
ncbi:MAG: right-handed parallel beta-helix repeat-containing protein [Saprospiraceae bacterium]|nr:right-handed parallel beta-helix repeat-containing protein [Saprospiraceae bacterium]